MTHWHAVVVFVCLAPNAGCDRSDRPSPGRDPSPPAAASTDGAAAEHPTEPGWARAQVVMTRTSGAISCDVRTLRGWARVACKTPDPGKPPRLDLAKGDLGDILDAQETGFYYRISEGLDVAAGFTSGTDKLGYHATWPKGAPRPAAVGVFEGGR